MLEQALNGCLLIDSRWWEELQPPRTDVLLSDEGLVTGVVSYAPRPRDEAGLLLWMHCREDHGSFDEQPTAPVPVNRAIARARADRPTR